MTAAVHALQRSLGVRDLTGKRFLDIGSGSGLSSLAATRLGASVHSFDFDPRCVACTKELKRRYAQNAEWTIEVGSVLDATYLRALGRFDIVYAWGVLHHTGALWRAMDHAGSMVAPGGYLLIAVYNDQGRASRRWRYIKRLYISLPPCTRFLILWPCFLRLWGPTTLRDLLHGVPFRTWRQYREDRGMSPWRDVVDWVGGYPFEVAKPEEVFRFYDTRGLTLVGLETCGGGHGCNELVFRKAFTTASIESS